MPMNLLGNWLIAGISEKILSSRLMSCRANGRLLRMLGTWIK